MEAKLQNSQIHKRSIVIDGHKTSISLEDAFWHELRIIAAKKGVGISKLVSTINDTRTSKNLSSAIRLFVLDHYRANTSSTG